MRTAHALHYPVSVQTYPWLSSPLLRYEIYLYIHIYMKTFRVYIVHGASISTTCELPPEIGPDVVVAQVRQLHRELRMMQDLPRLLARMSPGAVIETVGGNCRMTTTYGVHYCSLELRSCFILIIFMLHFISRIWCEWIIESILLAQVWSNKLTQTR